MGNVLVHVTMSLDGFMAGSNISVEQPMGTHGHRLHEWVFNTATSPIDKQVVEELFATTGAVILGKRTFDVGIGVWEDTPFPVPCFVLTHNARADLAMKRGTFTFITDGIEQALVRARTAAGEKNINIMGAETAQHFLNAGLVDELHLQIAPILLGQGRRLFEHLGTNSIPLERLGLIESPYVTHLRFRVMREREKDEAESAWRYKRHEHPGRHAMNGRQQLASTCGARVQKSEGRASARPSRRRGYSLAMIASAISAVPTAVGSVRLGFMS